MNQDKLKQLLAVVGKRVNDVLKEIDIPEVGELQEIGYEVNLELVAKLEFCKPVTQQKSYRACDDDFFAFYERQMREA